MSHAGVSIKRLNRRRRAVATVAVFVVASAPAVAAIAFPGLGGSGPEQTPCGSWPMYQGVAAHTADGCSTINISNVTSLRPDWFVSTAGAVSASPAVSDGTVYDGDSAGVFYALSETTGAKEWTFDTVSPQSCFLDETDPYTEQHKPGFGEITSSPAVQTVDGTPTVYVGAGGAVFALDATTGHCLWAQDVDPANPTSAIEVESSPVVDSSVNPPEVLIGDDDNSSPGIAVTGLMAFNAESGALLWKYEPERDLTLVPSEFGGSDALTLSCGDGVADTTYCNSTNVADLAPNTTEYADACGDVWSSPALDADFTDPAGDNTFEGSGTQPAGWYTKQITRHGLTSRDGLVVFGTGNCGANPTPAAALAHGDYVDNQGIFAVDPVTGVRVWDFVEPYNLYDNNANEPGDGDDDFGSSPLLASLPAADVPSSRCPSAKGVTTLVVEGSKSGYVYGICGRSGQEVWSVQAAQPGELGSWAVGALGGFIGSPALGVSAGQPAVFLTSAVPLPLSNDGIREPGGGDSNISSCPGVGSDALPLLPACLDTSIADDPTRVMSLHAVDAATGKVLWQAPSVPTYSAASYTNGVVFDPETTGFGVAAYNADTGRPLWAFPLAAAPASAAAIAGNSIFLGAGESEGSVDGQVLPPQAVGIWSFSTGSGVPKVTPPSLP